MSLHRKLTRIWREIWKLEKLVKHNKNIDTNMPTAEELATLPAAKVAKLAVEVPLKQDTEPVVLKFAKLSEHATAPTKGSKLAAGYDLYSADNYVIPPKGKILAKTDIQIAVPDGCYGRVAPRSGLAHKHFIDVGAGVIDQDYRGNVGVVMFNFSDQEFVVNKKDRIAQLIMERIFLPELQEFDKLDDTERGSGGFGSTGTN